jgi:phosphomannomutase
MNALHSIDPVRVAPETVSAELEAKVRFWLLADPDPETRVELEALLAQGAASELAERFSGPLEFGTAGLRGVMGGGPGRMNLAVVLQTAFGLGKVLLADDGAAALRGVVIGFDGRHKSQRFAEASATVLTALGIRCMLFANTEPTPLLAFTTKVRNAAAGIMVTASHNPPEYNGYKVYWGNGAQIVSPIDMRIAHAMTEAPRACDIATKALEQAKAEGLLVLLGPTEEQLYLEGVRRLRPTARRAHPARELGAIVYTAMHGVGAKLVLNALEAAGFYGGIHSVPEQEQPDPEFPTVTFPNPEEPGALDLAFALATQKRAALILANDPDADRLAVAAPKHGAFVQLTGNQVGVLLGSYCMQHANKSEHSRLLIASCVSSPMLGVIAKARGFDYEETLTGFKWIANRAIERANEAPPATFVFGYEEALGYSVGELVRDKDGVSAAVVFAELADELAHKGKTVWDALEALYREFGYFFSAQVNVTKKGSLGAKELSAMMDRLRQAPPTAIGGLAVTGSIDMRARTQTRHGVTEPFSLPASNVLVFHLEGGSRVIARPSGTEPKVKFYFDICEPFAASMAATEANAIATFTRLRIDFEACVGS